MQRVYGFRPAAGLKSGQFNRIENLTAYTVHFLNWINQASRKSFALAGGMDRIEKYEPKINPDNPVNPV
jgi:hypothetical protein